LKHPVGIGLGLVGVGLDGVGIADDLGGRGLRVIEEPLGLLA
jgi:hypothetical protein